ncbi:MAG: DUF512 domain-containing protein [Lachnospiraceae bacterium]|nr:DUF512 domain-containing protein [Lachnospiraceae bacterium]
MKKCAPEHRIKTVLPGSIAEELEIEPGDVLLSIDEQPIRDVFDYRFMIKDEELVVLIRKPDGEEWELEIEKDEDEDLGLEFENDLMSEYRSCSNKCIFCFIDQMPPGMRETLYFKDDDSRLSFLQGNYITLTNMSDDDIDRIIRMGLAPINVSVHSTEPELRCEMLHNRFAGDKLKYLDRLFEGHVEMNGQIVLCRGVNDGEHLDRTIGDLSKYLPFMRSLSVVPAGITKYRDGLYPLTLFSKEEAGAVIDQIEAWQKRLYEKWGLHFVHASDEWYILAERDFPEEDRYDGYLQLENGVGMMRLLILEFEEELESRAGESETGDKGSGDTKEGGFLRHVSVATGKLPYPTLDGFARRLESIYPWLKVSVHCIRNDFFGETITVTGLITGGDLIAQLSEKKGAGEDLGEVLLLPTNMLRSGEEVFLDDLTISDVKKALDMDVQIIGVSGSDFVRAVADGFYERDRENDEDSFVYVKEYDREEAVWEEKM